MDKNRNDIMGKYEKENCCLTNCNPDHGTSKSAREEIKSVPIIVAKKTQSSQEKALEGLIRELEKQLELEMLCMEAIKRPIDFTD